MPPKVPLPQRRLAPRPLGLHLSTAAMTWLSSLGALPFSKNASPGSSSLPGAGPDLVAQLAQAEPEALRSAVVAEIAARSTALAAGIEAYRRHGYQRTPAAWPVIWREGTTSLLDCGAGGHGPPVLVVPSLVNRGYILDLMPERSFVRAIAAAGFRPLLVDWDRPGSIERGLGLDGYIAGRLLRCLDAVVAHAGEPAILVGYCMGGLLALPLPLLRPQAVRGLVLLATPWDFHAERADLALALAAQARSWMPAVEALGELPVDGLQALFAGLDPFLVVRKFIDFARLDPHAARAHEFVALEDWLNDGVPLAAPVARDCLFGWYGANATATRRWTIGGRIVHPEAIRVASLVVVPAQDRIVPPASALALARALPECARLEPALGHIGMVSSARAPAMLWPDMMRWMAGLARR